MCQGRPFCKVRLPTYDQVVWNPAHETLEAICGENPDVAEFFSVANINAKCVGTW